MNRFTLLLLVSLLAINNLFAQHKCATMTQYQKRAIQDPSFEKRMIAAENLIQNLSSNSTQSVNNTITIPVVVHVLYNNSTQNISDQQIYSQLQGLNEDFRLLNADSLTPSHPFWQYTADTEIEFCLASVDPNWQATTGITRTQTSVASWVDADLGNIFSSQNGGKDNWDPTKYLNIYVVSLEGTTLGFASFPTELSTEPEYDGVVIRYEAFGSIGTAGSGGFDANDLGRTATHEVGHWLFLRHIWGDAACGDDFINDTPVAETENYNCPTFPHNANNQCNSDANGEMFMNYMDYVDDGCMNMFTFGQKTRMRNAIATYRSGLLSSNVCGTSTGLNDKEESFKFEIYPNPANLNLTIEFDNNDTKKIVIMNTIGAEVYVNNNCTESKINLNLDNVKSGLYFVTVSTTKGAIVKKLIIK